MPVWVQRSGKLIPVSCGRHHWVWKSVFLFDRGLKDIQAIGCEHCAYWMDARGEHSSFLQYITPTKHYGPISAVKRIQRK